MARRNMRVFLTAKRWFELKTWAITMVLDSDTRDLNYSLFFEKGEKKVAAVGEYASANAHRLTDDEVWCLGSIIFSRN